MLANTDGIGEMFTWVMVMNPLMSEVFSISDCIEVDVTYKSCYEIPYLFNAVAFNYLTMRCRYVGYSILPVMYT